MHIHHALFRSSFLYKETGKGWNKLVRKAKKLARTKKGRTYNPEFPFSPARFLSIADPRKPEARLFNYDGKLAEFAKVKTPIYVAFGTRDEGAVKPVKDYVSILWEKTRSKNFTSLIIRNARHSFAGYEDVLSNSIIEWLKSI